MIEYDTNRAQIALNINLDQAQKPRRRLGVGGSFTTRLYEYAKGIRTWKNSRSYYVGGTDFELNLLRIVCFRQALRASLASRTLRGPHAYIWQRLGSV